jgi:dTDP-4-dehydrorhamnose 3,5-epimerase
MEFRKGEIPGVIIRPVRKFIDDRGWLAEIFRRDELPDGLWPVMAYISESNPDVARGPHEHRDQSDLFAFLGPSNFKLWLWDNRKHLPSYGVKVTGFFGQDDPAVVIVPPGVAHAYKNIGGRHGWVFNGPNALYKGPGRKDEIDEIRHELDPKTPFVLD